MKSLTQVANFLANRDNTTLVTVKKFKVLKTKVNFYLEFSTDKGIAGITGYFTLLRGNTTEELNNITDLSTFKIDRFLATGNTVWMVLNRDLLAQVDIGVPIFEYLKNLVKIGVEV